MYNNQQHNIPNMDAKKVFSEKHCNMINAIQTRGMKKMYGLNIILIMPIQIPLLKDCSTAFLLRYMLNKKKKEKISRLNEM